MQRPPRSTVPDEGDLVETRAPPAGTLVTVTTTTLTPRPPLARRTTVALKLLMAVTGAFFAFFVLAHMYGNLKLLAGEDAFNTYAHHLRTMGEPIFPYAGLLWVLRLVLIVSLIAHVYAALTLWSRSGAARQTKYAMARRVLTSTTMRWGGVAIFVFVIWHLIQFTIVKVSVNPEVASATVVDNPYKLVVATFQVWWMTLIYVLAMVALWLHLAHGIYSAQQTLGWTGTPAKGIRAKGISHALTALIVVGFLIPPLSILFGLVK